MPKAIEEASPGDVIELRGGNYVSQEIRVPKITSPSVDGEWAMPSSTSRTSVPAFGTTNPKPPAAPERLEIIGGYYYGIKFETNWDWIFCALA